MKPRNYNEFPSHALPTSYMKGACTQIFLTHLVMLSDTVISRLYSFKKIPLLSLLSASHLQNSPIWGVSATFFSKPCCEFFIAF